MSKTNLYKHLATSHQAMKSELLTIAGLALASTLSSCASYDSSTNSQRRDYNPKIVEATSTSGEVYNLSHEEAERQMLRLAWRSDKEDSWAYIKPENKEGYLLDMGRNGVPTEVKPDLGELTSHLYRLRDIKKDVTFYHIHTFRRRKTENLESIMLPPLPAIPSEEDFKCYRVIDRICTRANATLKDGRVISPSQKSIFTHSQDTKDEMLKNIYEEIDKKYLSTEDIISKLKSAGCALEFKDFTDEQIEAALADQEDNKESGDKK